jgi:molecular chaperone GrpE
LAEEEKLPNDEPLQAQVEQTEDIEALEQALFEEKEKSERYLANWQRAQADFINYKKRAEQEKKETVEFANSGLLLNLLTVVDDLERAFVSLPPRLSKSSWIEGIELIYNKLKGILEAHGLTEIKAKGKPFDPHLHEAVMRQEGEEDIVIEEIQTGYKLKDRVLRPSKVIVGKGKASPESEPSSEEEGTNEEKED